MAAIEVEGLAKFRSDLKAAGDQFPKELAKAHQAIAKMATTSARDFARGTSPQAGHFANAITGSGAATEARIQNAKKANAALYGAKRHFGFYGLPQYDQSTGRQSPPWVGQSWEVGALGEGPIGINPAIHHDLPRFQAELVRMLDTIARRAGFR